MRAQKIVLLTSSLVLYICEKCIKQFYVLFVNNRWKKILLCRNSAKKTEVEKMIRNCPEAVEVSI